MLEFDRMPAHPSLGGTDHREKTLDHGLAWALLTDNEAQVQRKLMRAASKALT